MVFLGTQNVQVVSQIMVTTQIGLENFISDVNSDSISPFLATSFDFPCLSYKCGSRNSYIFFLVYPYIFFFSYFLIYKITTEISIYFFKSKGTPLQPFFFFFVFTSPLNSLYFKILFKLHHDFLTTHTQGRFLHN